MMNRPLIGTIVIAVTASACASRSGLLRQECYDPDWQLAQLLTPLEANRAIGCGTIDAAGRTVECNTLRREIERLALVCPGHTPTLMSSAVIAYESGARAQAQQFLDQIFEQPRSQPEAAMLRARIAVEQGDLPFARRFLEAQIRLAPDHAGLHETYAAALFLGGAMDDARRELTTAGRLGAPRWRVAYHLGLLEEAAQRLDEARRLYAEALAAHPGWEPAQARLNALRTGG